MDCGKIEDVAEIIGEITDGLNGSSSMIFLRSFDNIKYCLQNCLSPSEKSSWTNMSSIAADGNLGLIENDHEYNCSNVEESACQLISIIRSLVTHLKNHSSSMDAVQILPSPSHKMKKSPHFDQGRKIQIEFQNITLSFFKYLYINSCHLCDVAAILLYVLSSYFDKEKFSCEDIYSNNSNTESSFRKFSDEYPDLERLSMESRVTTEKFQNAETARTCVKFVDEEPKTHSIYGEQYCLYSEMDPIKADQISSCGQSGVCVTMPPCFTVTEERRNGSVIYGGMDKVLELLKNKENKRIKNDFGMLRNEVTGVILNKYKKIIKVKNYESYDEGIHFIKVPLGSGCSGKCYFASDTSSRHSFCLKIVQSFKASEIEAWAALSEVKGVPKFYGLMYHSDQVYIFQEFIHGPTLQSLITKSGSRLDVRQSLEIFKELLFTLSELHRRNIIHNDVKADNIIVGERQVLLDFGLSVQSKNGIEEGANPCGSQCHWSPEKAASERHGTKSDVWAATVVFVHMVSGVQPWLNRFCNSKALHYIIKTKSPPLEDVPDGLPNVVLDLIKVGWTLDPNLRPSAEELIDHEAFSHPKIFDRCESTTSPGLTSRSGSENIEDVINRQLRDGQKLLMSTPSVIGDSECNVQDTLMIKECNEILKNLNSAPERMIFLSKEILEEMQLFLGESGNSNLHDGEDIPKASPSPDRIYADSSGSRVASFRSKIPVSVEEQSLSSESSEEGARLERSQISEDFAMFSSPHFQAAATVLLEDGMQIYTCNLSLGSDTKWSDLAERCSFEVHSRNIPRFYLVLHPSGEKITPSENIMSTLARELKGIEATPLPQRPLDGSGSGPRAQRSKHLSRNFIKAKVVEIQSDVQSWDWKVENGVFTFSYGSHWKRAFI